MKSRAILAVLALMLFSQASYAAMAQVGDAPDPVPIRPPIRIEIVENMSYDVGHMDPAELPVPARVGEPYDLLISAKGGGVSGYIWTLEGLPPEGLKVESVSGNMILIEGTPSTIGSYETRLVATDRAFEHVKGEIKLTIKVVSQ